MECMVFGGAMPYASTPKSSQLLVLSPAHLQSVVLHHGPDVFNEDATNKASGVPMDYWLAFTDQYTNYEYA